MGEGGGVRERRTEEGRVTESRVREIAELVEGELERREKRGERGELEKEG